MSGTEPYHYVTAAWSHFLGSESGGGSHVLQAVDRDTGVVFERVCQGGGTGDGQFPGYSSDLSYELMPATSLTTGIPYRAEEPTMPWPSMILTVPTPVPPQSPIFAPQSPITVSKFFEALDEETTFGGQLAGQLDVAPSLGQPPPSLGSCGECGLFEFEQGLQCRECDTRWLACKVWYHAQDGGRRRWLAAPYIRPGESNAQNRALMHGLGVPGCDPGVDDAAVATAPDPLPVRARHRLRRARCFVRSKAMHARRVLFHLQTSSYARNIKAYAGIVVLQPARLTFKRAAGLLGLEYLWRRLSGAWWSRGRTTDQARQTRTHVTIYE